MTFQAINLGFEPNDGTGDDLRTAGGKINANFNSLFGKIALATSEVAGLMSPQDKIKLDKALTEIALATTKEAGLMSPADKARLDAALTEVALATTNAAGLMSPEDKIKLDKALTEVALATPEAAGLMSPKDKTKLDGIAAGANVVGTGITAVVAITQAAYDALAAPDAKTLYVITGAS
jgi:hypothetical protein